VVFGLTSTRGGFPEDRGQRGGRGGGGTAGEGIGRRVLIGDSHKNSVAPGEGKE